MENLCTLLDLRSTGSRNIYEYNSEEKVNINGYKTYKTNKFIKVPKDFVEKYNLPNDRVKFNHILDLVSIQEGGIRNLSFYKNYQLTIR